jgi:hypothetical protein
MRRLDNEGMLPTRVVTGDILLGFLPLSRALLIPHVSSPVRPSSSASAQVPPFALGPVCILFLIHSATT